METLTLLYDTIGVTNDANVIPIICLTVALIIISYRVIQHRGNSKVSKDGRNNKQFPEKSTTSYPSFDDCLSDDSEDENSWISKFRNTANQKNKIGTNKKGKKMSKTPSVSQSLPTPRSFRSGRTDLSVKPFESSYYYAHNSSKKTGGYSDGLKAEDYVMNGPRLLSKLGEDAAPPDNNGGPSGRNPIPSDASLSLEPSQIVLLRSKLRGTALSKYLIDESKDKDVVATLYISDIPGYDSLQTYGVSKSGISTDFWSTGKRTSCATIQMHNDNGEEFHLVIKKVNGLVKDVKLILKKNRLIVKLMKHRIGGKI